MIKTTLSALTLVLSIGSMGAAAAQAIETNPERLHDARLAHVASGSAGTVGAMEAYVYGLATSPQDVILQQEGRAPAGEGAHPIKTAAPVDSGYSSGTVGAAPGW